MSATASSSPIAKALPVWRDPAAWMKTADIVAVLLALSLPWSTSLVGILGVVLLITVAPTLELKSFLALLKRPISALPIALFVLALVGTCGRTPPGARGSMPWGRLRNSWCSRFCSIISSARRVGHGCSWRSSSPARC